MRISDSCPGFVVILRDSFANFSCGAANDVIEVGVVMDVTPKYFDSECPFF